MWKGLLFATLIACSTAGPTPDPCEELKACSECVEVITCQWSEEAKQCSLFTGVKGNNTRKTCFEVQNTSEAPALVDEEEQKENDAQNSTFVDHDKEVETTTTIIAEDDAEETTLNPAPSTTPKTTPPSTTPKPIVSTSASTAASPSDVETTIKTTTSSTTTSSNTTTTTSTTSTTTTTTTTSSAPHPEDRSSFDGWSFFGGILLTLGFFSIGFVGLKYYRVRSRTDADYNRF